MTSAKLRSFLTDLSEETDLVLSVTNGTSGAVNAHGRFFLHRKAWPPSSPQPALEEEMLGLGLATDAKTTTEEPQVHVHVDWTKVTRVKFETNPVNRIGCDIKIVLAGDAGQVLAFYAKEATLKHLVSGRYPRGDWIVL